MATNASVPYVFKCIFVGKRTMEGFYIRFHPFLVPDFGKTLVQERDALVVRLVARMNQDNKLPRSVVVQAEIRYRWPSLPICALNGEVRTLYALAILLSEQMGFCENRALMEANGFWNDLEERFRLATTS